MGSVVSGGLWFKGYKHFFNFLSRHFKVKSQMAEILNNKMNIHDLIPQSTQASDGSIFW